MMTEGDASRPSADPQPGSRPATAHDVHLVRMLLQTGKHVESVVSTGSMGRALPIGSRIRIRRCSERSPSHGQIVAFLAGDRIVVHRVVYAGRRGAAREFLITRGDADWLCDPPVHIELVAGCVDEMSIDEQWRRIEPAQTPHHRPVLSSLARALLAVALEISPRSAATLGRCMFLLRVRMRRLLSRVPSQRSNVRT